MQSPGKFLFSSCPVGDGLADLADRMDSEHFFGKHKTSEKYIYQPGAMRKVIVGYKLL